MVFSVQDHEQLMALTWNCREFFLPGQIMATNQTASSSPQMSNEKNRKVGWVFVGDEILPSYIGIIKKPL